MQERLAHQDTVIEKLKQANAELEQEKLATEVFDRHGLATDTEAETTMKFSNPLASDQGGETEDPEASFKDAADGESGDENYL